MILNCHSAFCSASCLHFKQVTDFRIVLSSVQATTRQLQSLDNDMVDHLQKLISKSYDVSFEIEILTESDLIQKSKEKCRVRPKVSLKTWLKKHGDIDKFSTRLRELGMEIAEVCTILTASAVPRVRIQLDQISVAHQELSIAMAAHTLNTSHQLEKSVANVASLQTQDIHGALSENHFGPRPHNPSFACKHHFETKLAHRYVCVGAITILESIPLHGWKDL